MADAPAKKLYNVAVVGATGVVGQEFLRILATRHFPLKSLGLFASKRSAGKRIFGSARSRYRATAKALRRERLHLRH
jgi:aspartate-semialdehyde dehydrogenase